MSCQVRSSFDAATAVLAMDTRQAGADAVERCRALMQPRQFSPWTPDCPRAARHGPGRAALMQPRQFSPWTPARKASDAAGWTALMQPRQFSPWTPISDRERPRCGLPALMQPRQFSPWTPSIGPRFLAPFPSFDAATAVLAMDTAASRALCFSTTLIL